MFGKVWPFHNGRMPDPQPPKVGVSSYLTWQSGLTVAVVLAGVAAAISDRRRLAFVWAALLPVDYLIGVRVTMLDALRYSGAIVLALLFAPTLATHVRTRLHQLGAVLMALAAVRGVAALAHGDPNGRRFAIVLALATAVAYMVAIRPRLHLHLVLGYMSGLTLSVVVSIMQALHLPILAVANYEGQRYPGLSTYTMLFTWQVAIGLVVLGVIITSRLNQRDAWFWVAVALFPLFGLAMMANGAQGGLLGLFTAFLGFLRFGPIKLTRPSDRRWMVAAMVLVMVTVSAAFLTQIELPTITDWGDGNYHNERARFDIIFDGWHEFTNHPLTGVSRTEFINQYNIAPHFLPVGSAAMAGVAGLALSVGLLAMLGWWCWKGPANREPATLAGFLVLLTLTTNTLTDSYGPFVGVSRAFPLWIALVAAAGHWPSSTLEPESEPHTTALDWWQSRSSTPTSPDDRAAAHPHR